MKKIFAILLAVMLIASMANPAYAVTPRFKIPEVPQISRIDFKVTLGEDFWNRYWEKHPIKINWTALTKPAEVDNDRIKALQKWSG